MNSKEKMLDDINKIARENNIKELSNNFDRREISEFLYNVYIKDDVSLYSNLIYENRHKSKMVIYSEDSKQIVEMVFALAKEFINDEYAPFLNVRSVEFFCFSIIDYLVDKKKVILLKNFDIFKIGYPSCHKDEFIFLPKFYSECGINYHFIKTNLMTQIHLKNFKRNAESSERYQLFQSDGRVYFYKDENIFNEYINIEQENCNLYHNYSKIILEPCVKIVVEKLKRNIMIIKDLDKDRKMDNSFYMVANANNRYKIVKDIIDNTILDYEKSEMNYGNIRSYLLQDSISGEDYSSYYLMILSNKCFAKINIKIERMDEYEKQQFANVTISDPEYYYLVRNDSITIINEKTEKTVDFGTKATPLKKETSVIGGAMIGGLIGGSTGSLIGAMAAVDKNNKIRASNNSISTTMKYTSTGVECYLKISCNHMNELLEFNIKFDDEFIRDFLSRFNDLPSIFEVSEIISKDNLLLLEEYSNLNFELLRINEMLSNIKGIVMGKKLKYQKELLEEKENKIIKIDKYRDKVNSIISSINVKL